MEILVQKSEALKIDVKYMSICADVRYPEDAEINGVSDVNGELMPFLQFGIWKPVIEVESGKILDWPNGKTADVHYKVCDQFSFKLLDVEKYVLYDEEFGYVPKVMCPNDNGYGDYIIMQIDENGIIKDWNFKQFSLI